MSNIELSWQNSVAVSNSANIIDDLPSLSGTISDPLPADRIDYKIMYLRNNGPTSIDGTPVDGNAYNLGFYVRPYGPEHSDNYNFEDVIQWSQLQDADGRAYGIFTVFGYDSSSNEWITQFINNTISPSSLAMFQHNWVQGTSPSNSIKLDTAYTYNNGAASRIGDFPVYDSSYATSSYGETNGILRVCFGVRVPDGIDATRVLLNHTLYYEEGI